MNDLETEIIEEIKSHEREMRKQIFKTLIALFKVRENENYAGLCINVLNQLEKR